MAVVTATLAIIKIIDIVPLRPETEVGDRVSFFS